jgi:RimJ/RimL family protein N-acetyltransferase
LDAEVFSFEALETAHLNAKLPSEREHVTPYIRKHPERFNIGQWQHHPNLSHLRWTVDEPEDFLLVKQILGRLYPLNPEFAMQDVLNLLNKRPGLSELNAHHQRNEGALTSQKADEAYQKGITSSESSQTSVAVYLRKATPKDVDLLFQWANDPDVRKAAFCSREIGCQEHQAWFSQKLADPHCFHYIALDSLGSPVGQIRFAIHKQTAEIDYSVARICRSQGYGQQILTAGIDKLSTETARPLTLSARVLTSNRPSSRIFAAAGFEAITQASNPQPKGKEKRHLVYRLSLSPPLPASTFTAKTQKKVNPLQPLH